MGFLKELFEKKLKASTSISSRDFYEESEVPRSAQSEWSLPQLRPQKNQEDNSELGSLEWGADAAGASAADSVCYLQAQVQPSAKSFSFAVQRRQQLEQAEKAQAAQQSSWHVPPHVKYENINQFSQKVELYRGSAATVLKAVCVATSTKVIVKAYYKSKMHPKHYHKLAREVDAMKALNGPYVAEFYASFEDAQCIYIVMEYCEGGDLFKTMLMHGGLLDEQWVCVEVITPLLRILEKMHTGMKLLHRDIKPENIFLTSLGKFRLGDFGLAIKFDKELPFSRSGTLDYMAPEVLRNPSVPFQEGKAVELAMLAARGVKPYGPPVDVWAAGVLAYELVCGRPPFEVEDEAQTAALIMYSESIKFPPNRSPQWSDFVRSTLVKSPELRPTATALLKHPWVVNNLQRTLSECNRPSKEMLLQPLPLDLAQAGSKAVKRTLSLAGTAGSGNGGGRGGSAAAADAAEQQAAPALPALPAGGVPAGLSGPALPAAFPAMPTGAARNMQHLHLGFGERDGREARTLTGSTNGGAASRLSGLSLAGSGDAFTSASGGSSSSSGGGSNACGYHSAAGTISSSGSNGGSSSGGAGLSVSLPASPKASFSGAHLSPLNPSANGGATATGSGGSLSGAASSAAAAGGAGMTVPRTPTRASAAGSPLKPALSLGLKVTLPPETEFELCGSGDSFCYSPTTPAPKPGIKERMKFYFQRQAGAAGGF